MTYNLFYYFAIGLLLFSLVFAVNSIARVVIYYLTLASSFLFSAFRYEVGCDWYQYAFIYEVFPERPLNLILTGLEPGFYLTVKFLDALGLPYVWLNIVSSGVFFAGIHAIARRQIFPIAFLVLAIPIFVINMPMSAVRQAMAVGFMCFAFISYSDRKSIRFICFTLAAFIFHSSAIVFLLLWPLTLKRLTGKTLFITAVLSIPAALYFLTLQGSIGAIDRHVQNLDAAIAFGAPYRITLLTLTGLTFLLVAKRWKIEFTSDFELVKLGSLAMIFFPFLYIVSLFFKSVLGFEFFTSVIADRFGYYMVPIQLIILTRLPSFYSKQSLDLKRTIPFVIFGIWLYAWTSFSFIHERCYQPYDFDTQLVTVLTPFHSIQTG